MLQDWNECTFSFWSESILDDPFGCKRYLAQNSVLHFLWRFYVRVHSSGHSILGSCNPTKGDRIFGRVRPNPPASRSFETKSRCVQGIQSRDFLFLISVLKPQVKSKLLPSEYSNYVHDTFCFCLIVWLSSEVYSCSFLLIPIRKGHFSLYF